MSAYCAKSDVELVFGVSNVAKWADADNSADEDSITDRIAWAIEDVSARIDGRLAVRFTVPLTTIPTQIKNIAARMVGVTLYKFPRGIADGTVSQDFDTMEEQCNDDLSRILTGNMIIPALIPIGTSAPGVVEFTGKSVTDNA